MRSILLTIVLSLVVLGYPVITHARPHVQLYSCLAPKGYIKASYESGTHGIVGRLGTYTGRDTVYQIGDNVLQCYCGSQGNGIQTNWVNAKSMTADNIKSFRVQGWEHVENGVNWGLSNDPYIALNTNYSCLGTGGGITGTGTGGAEYMFAPTGNTRTILGIWALGSALLFNAFVLKKRMSVSL